MSLSNPALESADVVSLGDEQRAIEILSQSVLGLWEVVNNLTRLRATRREEFRVTIFGSARIPPDPTLAVEMSDPVTRPCATSWPSAARRPQRNASAAGPLAEVGRAGAPVRVLVVRTDEELQIARETLATVRGVGAARPAPPG